MVDLSPNVVAAWHLNSSSGSIAIDSSPNNYNGTLINMEDGDWVAGKLNNCLQLDGTNEYITCGNIIGFERTDSFSFECWFKSSAVDIYQIILNKREGATESKGYALMIDKNGQINFFLGHEWTTNYIAVRGGTDILDGAWHHIITTYDGSSDASGVKIYLDNVPEGLSIVLNSLTESTLNSSDLRIGHNHVYGYSPLGFLDEVVIYDKELTPTEVSQRWNSGNGTEDYGQVAPTIPNNPTPIDTGTDIAYSQNLSWEGVGDMFDIYFGISSPPSLVASDQVEFTYNLNDLDSCTLYYWKIVAKNYWGTEETSSEWTFTTGNELPVTPFDNSPVHRATNQELSLILSWDCEDYNTNDSLVYDIYFGKPNNPPLVKANHGSKTYTISGLEYDEIYHWKIIAKDNASCGTHDTVSPLWKFTTKEEPLGGYLGFDVRQIIRSHFGKVEYKSGSEITEYYFKVDDKLGDSIHIPMYLSEEVKSGSIKEMPYLDFNLALATFKPHDVGAQTRRKEAYVDIGLWYADTDNITRENFGSDIVDRLMDYIRSHQCSFTNIDFINVESVRLLKESNGHQVIYHWVITVYAIYYDLTT